METPVAITAADGGAGKADGGRGGQPWPAEWDGCVGTGDVGQHAQSPPWGKQSEFTAPSWAEQPHSCSSSATGARVGCNPRCAHGLCHLPRIPLCSVLLLRPLHTGIITQRPDTHHLPAQQTSPRRVRRRLNATPYGKLPRPPFLTLEAAVAVFADRAVASLLDEFSSPE